MSMFSPGKGAVPDIPPPPTPAQAPKGTRPSKKPMTPTFLGTGTVPDPTSGGATGKTLLGQ